MTSGELIEALKAGKILFSSDNNFAATNYIFMYEQGVIEMRSSFNGNWSKEDIKNQLVTIILKPESWRVHPHLSSDVSPYPWNNDYDHTAESLETFLIDLEEEEGKVESKPEFLLNRVVREQKIQRAFEVCIKHIKDELNEGKAEISVYVRNIEDEFKDEVVQKLKIYLIGYNKYIKITLTTRDYLGIKYIGE